MIINFKYTGEGITDIWHGKQINKGDVLKYDTDRKPSEGDIIVAQVNGEFRVMRYHSRMRKKKDGFELKGVVTFI